MGLFSAIGGVAGSYFGPIGSAAGSAIGGQLDGDGRPSGAPGGSATGGPSYQYQEYEREKVLPDFLQQPVEDTVGAVMDAGTQPFNPYAFQDRPELFAPDERRAQELYRGIPDKYSPYIQGGLDVVGESQRMALHGPSSELIQGYMNPFIEQTLDVQKDRSLQDYQMMQSDLQRRAGQVDSFGGSRFGLQSAQLADDYGQRTNELESTMLMGGYDRAMAGMERGLERGMDPRYVSGFQGADLQGINALNQSGQQQYQRDFGEFMREETDPMLKAGFLSRNMQPWAATLAGERGSSMGYSDPNAGSIAEGLGIGSAIEGLGGPGGISDMFGGGGRAPGGSNIAETFLNGAGRYGQTGPFQDPNIFGRYNHGGRIGYNSGGLSSILGQNGGLEGLLGLLGGGGQSGPTDYLSVIDNLGGGNYINPGNLGGPGGFSGPLGGALSGALSGGIGGLLGNSPLSGALSGGLGGLLSGGGLEGIISGGLSGLLGGGGGGIFNRGGPVGYNSGGSADPYAAYLAAATTGNYISPGSFSSMPTMALGGGGVGVEGGAGGLLGALEALQEEQNKDEGKNVPGPEAETSQDDLEEAKAATEAKNRGGVLGYQQGGVADLDEQTLFELLDNLIEDRPESILNTSVNRAKQGLYGATDLAIGAGLEGLGAVGEGIKSGLMPVEDARQRAIYEGQKGMYGLKEGIEDASFKGLQGVGDFIVGAGIDGEEFLGNAGDSLNSAAASSRQGIDSAIQTAKGGIEGGLSAMASSAKEGIEGIKGMTPPTTPLEYLNSIVDKGNIRQKELLTGKLNLDPEKSRSENLGAILNNVVDKGKGLGLAAATAPFDVARKTANFGDWMEGSSAHDKRLKGAENYYDTAQTRYDEEQKQLEAFIAAGTPAAKIGADAALESATSGPQGTLQSTPAMQKRVAQAAQAAQQGSGFDTTEDVRQKRLGRRSLSDAVDKQAVKEQRRRSALLAFGASITQGGGLAQSLPRAALAYDNAIKSQESAALQQRMQFEKLELDRIASDRQQAYSDSMVKQNQSNVYWKGYENVTARMKAAADGKGTWTEKDVFASANKARDAAVAANNPLNPVQPLSYYIQEQAKVAMATRDPRLIALYRSIESQQGATGGSTTVSPQEYLNSQK